MTKAGKGNRKEPQKAQQQEQQQAQQEILQRAKNLAKAKAIRDLYLAEDSYATRSLNYKEKQHKVCDELVEKSCPKILQLTAFLNRQKKNLKKLLKENENASWTLQRIDEKFNGIYSDLQIEIAKNFPDIKLDELKKKVKVLPPYVKLLTRTQLYDVYTNTQIDNKIYLVSAEFDEYDWYDYKATEQSPLIRGTLRPRRRYNLPHDISRQEGILAKFDRDKAMFPIMASLDRRPFLEIHQTPKDNMDLLVDHLPLITDQSIRDEIKLQIRALESTLNQNVIINVGSFLYDKTSQKIHFFRPDHLWHHADSNLEKSIPHLIECIDMQRQTSVDEPIEIPLQSVDARHRDKLDTMCFRTTSESSLHFTTSGAYIRVFPFFNNKDNDARERFELEVAMYEKLKGLCPQIVASFLTTFDVNWASMIFDIPDAERVKAFYRQFYIYPTASVCGVIINQHVHKVQHLDEHFIDRGDDEIKSLQKCVVYLLVQILEYGCFIPFLKAKNIHVTISENEETYKLTILGRTHEWKSRASLQLLSLSSAMDLPENPNKSALLDFMWKNKRSPNESLETLFDTPWQRVFM